MVFNVAYNCAMEELAYLKAVATVNLDTHLGSQLYAVLISSLQ